MKFFAAVTRIIIASTMLAVAGTSAAQQDYPNKPIRIVVPLAPGGTVDYLARLVGQKLTDSWGQQVIVENRPGGNNLIGTDAVAKSPPDGYTVLLVTVAHVMTSQLLPTPYDPIKDFAPVATVASTEYILALHPSVAANNLQEFITLAKSRPGQLNYGSGGTGTSTHLPVELLNIMAGIRMQHIPYKGTGQLISDLVGGQVQLAFLSPVTLIPHTRTGKLKAIAVSGETRLSAMPQVPTFTESGLPGFVANTWFGLLAPSGTPRATVEKLSTEIGRILTMADTREKLTKQGVEPLISTPDQFAASLKADLAKWGKVIKTANIKLDQ